VSALLTWRTLDEAGEARTAANRLVFLPQTQAFSGRKFFWPRNLPQERYTSIELAPKMEIPVSAVWTIAVSLSIECQDMPNQ